MTTPDYERFAEDALAGTRLIGPQPARFQHGGLVALIGRPSSASSAFPQYFVNSVVVSSATTILALVLGSLAAYSLTRFRFRFGSTILIAMFMTRLVPPIAIVVPLYLIWREVGLIDTQFALVITYLSFTLPFVVWLMRGFLKDIPIDLEEAAMTDAARGLAPW